MLNRANLPTWRELLHFAAWLIVAGVLIFVAIRHNNALRHRHDSAIVPQETAGRIAIDRPDLTTGRDVPSSSPAASVTAPALTGSTAARGAGSSGINPRHESSIGTGVPSQAELAYVRDILTRAAQRGRAHHPADWDRAREIAATAAGFRYVPGNDGWVLPEETWARGYGDCQGKSLYVAVRLLEAGYRGVGLRFGCPPNYRPGQPGHVWPVIERDDGEIVFEPTSSSEFFSPSTAPTRRHSVTATVFPDSPN